VPKLDASVNSLIWIESFLYYKHQIFAKMLRAFPRYALCSHLRWEQRPFWKL